MTTNTYTYTYSFQVDPEIQLHLGGLLEQQEQIGFQKSLERIKELEFKLSKARKALEFYSLVDDETGTYDCNVARNALKEIGE